jgi:endonuclease/exonuclease/phosphatase family metal-dependent hydrolase
MVAHRRLRPHRDLEKVPFVCELCEVRVRCNGPWLVGGDFNLIYKAADKNNGHHNRRFMGIVHHFLQDLGLVELHLQGRLYMWSNEQAHPTLSRIDRAFTCAWWCELFPHHRKCVISSAYSDHLPLLLHACSIMAIKGRFKFEAMWPRLPGYLGVVG